MPAASPSGGNTEVFQLLQSGSPEFKMTGAHASYSAGLNPHTQPASPAGSQRPEIYPSIPPALSTDPRTSLQLPLMYRADEELRAILQALPTKADIEDLVGCVETTHRKEICTVKQEVQSLSVGETSLSMLDRKVATIEATKRSQTEASVGLQLHMEEMQDRSRRNNLRHRSLPEATGPTDLVDTVTDIFRRVGGDQLQGRLEFD